MTSAVWFAFFVACLLIAISPGPGAATSMSNGLRYGYFKSLRAIAGLQVALLFQLLIVFVGLGALLASSTTAFMLVKICGASYLIWLGVQKWRSSIIELTPAGLLPKQERLFLQGFLVNISNPKAIVFMAALTPQFIDPAAAQLPQFILMALTMCGVDAVVMSAYALLAAKLRPWMASPTSQRWQNRFFGGFFVLAGGALIKAAR